MKLFIFLLSLAAFIQTAFLPLNLCLIILICRAYAAPQRSNYYLALLAGTFLGILSAFNIGFYSGLFLVLVFLIQSLRLLPITGKFITVFPVLFLALTISMLFENLIYHLSLSWWNPLAGSLLGLPIFLIVREWEDRFIVKSGIKLKV
jgi:hypothetical protein